MNTVKFWLNNARKTALPQSVLPAVLAACMASRVETFSLPLAVLSIIGVAAAHLGMNLFDDYFDYRKKGVDVRIELVNAGFRARLAKCDYILSGKATVKELLTAAVIFCAVAMLAGVTISFWRGSGIYRLILIAGFLGISYSGSPFRFSYRGLGELLIGTMFGPLLMVGVYYASCGTLDPAIWIVSIPIGMLVANIIFTHSIMDYEPDKRIGKMTLAVLLNNRKSMIAVSALFIYLPYLFISAGLLGNYLSFGYTAVFLTLPMAIGLSRLLLQFTGDRKEETVKPRFWMGPMENWKRIQAAQIDWFMIRWMLSRNLLSFFCLILIVLSFI
ncbi:MAG: prenyltransferase [Mediterranea sp.]|jgi:1,4-dihydroxy-2-naphthoate octaprenyltransferase|nr:prenyltransferase [Mediterranea sp.]